MGNTGSEQHHAVMNVHRETTYASGKRALVLGASGLVGGELVRLLAGDPAYSKVTALVRRPLSFSHDKLEQKVTEFDRLDSLLPDFQVDDVYCCLGTTIKKAGSQEAFRRVDLELPLQAARLARQAGAGRFLAISSLGANEHGLVFYSRVKGEMERRLRETGLAEIHIFRPSLLLGERSEPRFGESAAARVYRAMPFLFGGPLRRYRPIYARTVASAMAAAARRGKAGFFLYESDEIARMGSTDN